MNNIIKRVWNQNRMVQIEDLSGMTFQAESGGHTFEISGVDDTGAAVALSGTVTGVFRRPDNADIALTGSASDGVVSVTLTNDCYAVPGRFGLVVYVTSDSQKTAVYACVGTVAQTNGGAVAGSTPQDVVDLINAISAAVATIPADYSGLLATIAPDYSNTALYSVGSYAWYSGVLKRCVVPITTGETYTAAKWENAVLGDDISQLTDSAILVNSLAAKGEYTFSSNDFESGYWSFTSKAAHSKRLRTRRLIPVSAGEYVTYTNPTMKILISVFATRKASSYAQTTGWIDAGTDAGITITADGFMIIMFASTSDVMPSDYDSTVRLVTVPYRQFGIPTYDASTDTIVGEISTYAGRLVRRYNSGLNAEYSLSSFWAETQLNKYTTPQGVNILPIYGNIESPYTRNGITFSWKDYHIIHVEGTASAEANYNLIISRHVPIPGIVAGEDVLFKVKNAPSGVNVQVWKYTGGTDSGSVLYSFAKTCLRRIHDDSTGQLIRLNIASGTAIAAGGVDIELEIIAKPAIKHLRVLLIGNSYTNDCSAYAPLIAEGLSKNVAITLGTTYYSGASIDNYIDWFDNDSAVLTYYKYNALSNKYDTALSSRTLKQCIANEPWDIIVFQQASSAQGTWSTFSNLNTLINKVLTYNATLHSKAVKIGWMFPQLRYSIIGSTTYAKVVECVQNVLNTTPIDFFIPCGTAVQNARGTSLDSIGDSGHLCADGDGHLQAGLPSLLASYVSALKLLELAGEPWHGILQDATRPTATWVTNINSPGENGTSTGVTDENCYLAQKCAVAAIKFPTTVSTVV